MNIRKAFLIALALSALSWSAQAASPRICPMIASTSNWRAHMDGMPGPGARPTLTVSGDVALRGQGYKLVLRPGPTDRSARPAQRFDLVITPARIISETHIVTQRVEARTPALGPYRALMVFCGDQGLALIENIVRTR